MAATIAILYDRISNSLFRRMHTKTSLVSRKIIKPLSPTPESLSCYKLCSSDQTIPSIYVPFAFFYPPVTNSGFGRSQISQQIENSLSKTLSYYYPFAGRLVGNDHIICNDAGVEFQEAQINSPMSKILKNSQEDIVFPRGLQWNAIQNPEDSLVVIKLNYFDCGGIAIAVCISHKIADGATMGIFVKDLANTSSQSNDTPPSPQFIANTIFPPIENPISFPAHVPASGISRRYIFDAASIEKLKTMAIDSGVEKPTRVEVVTALLYQSALAASSSGLSSFKPSVLIQPMNLRPLIGSPLKHNSVGNIWTMNMLVLDDKCAKFSRLVGELRSAKVKVQNDYKQKLNSNSPLQDMLKEFLKLVSDGGFNVYQGSSNCRFPFYEVDFGWGKPIRVSIGQYPGKDTFFLTDTPGNGIEALISLDVETLSKFEQDKELLSFASPYVNE